MSDGKGSMMPVKQQEDDDNNDEVMVVQGTAVDDHHRENMETEAAGTPNDEYAVMKGEMQPPAYRDWFFTVLFLIQLFAISATAMAFGPAMFKAIGGESDEDNSNDGNGGNNQNDDESSSPFDDVGVGSILTFLVLVFVFASLITVMAFRVMIHHPLESVQVSFFVAPITFGFVALLVMVAAQPSDANDNEGSVHDAIVGMFWGAAAVFSAISICFYVCYKRFMPFAATNLKVALTAVRANGGLFFLSVGSVVVVWAWSWLWIVAFGGIIYHDQQKPQVDCNELHANDDEFQYQDGQMCDQQPNAVAVVLLLLCLYWTSQVIQNTVHTTTAGAVSTWWIQPEDDSADFGSNGGGGGGCCGRDVSDSLHRACTYSFGSICFGSLLVAILQTLEQMGRNRNRRDLLNLVIQCIIICLRAWLEYFNSWAFCYVGIYGYDYLTAGRKVIELFKARGWTQFITDRLVFRVILLANLGIAALTGACSVLVMLFLSRGAFGSSDAQNGALLAAFWVGFLVGLIVSSTVLFVVESSVRTIMVCFAEQPGEGSGRPLLMQELRDTYAATYPGVFVFSRGPTRNIV